MVTIRSYCIIISLLFCKTAQSIECPSALNLKEQLQTHLKIQYMAWDSGITGYLKVHGLPDKNGYHIVGFQFGAWQVLTDKAPLLNASSVEDAKNKVMESLSTLSIETPYPIDLSNAGSECIYTLAIDNDVHHIELYQYK